MFIERGRDVPALRQEGNVYRESNGSSPPSVRRAMFIESRTDRVRPPSGGPCVLRPERIGSALRQEGYKGGMIS